MSDRGKVKGTLAAIHPTGRRRLSFREVVDCGQPAVYRQFGDSLLFVDGTLFDVLTPASPLKLGLKLPPKDPHFARRVVGIAATAAPTAPQALTGRRRCLTKRMTVPSAVDLKVTSSMRPRTKSRPRSVVSSPMSVCLSAKRSSWSPVPESDTVR